MANDQYKSWMSGIKNGNNGQDNQQDNSVKTQLERIRSSLANNNAIKSLDQRMYSNPGNKKPGEKTFSEKVEQEVADLTGNSNNDDGEATTIDVTDDDYVWGMDFSNDYDKYAQANGLGDIGDFMINGDREQWRSMLQDPNMRDWYADDDVYTNGVFDDDKFEKNFWNVYKPRTLDDIMSVDSSKGSNISDQYFSQDNDTITNTFDYLVKQGYMFDGLPGWAPSEQLLKTNDRFSGYNDDQYGDWYESISDEDKVKLLKYDYLANAMTNAEYMNEDDKNKFREAWIGPEGNRDYSKLNDLNGIDLYEIINDENLDDPDLSYMFNDWGDELAANSRTGYFYDDGTDAGVESSAGRFIPRYGMNDQIKAVFGNDISFRKKNGDDNK